MIVQTAPHGSAHFVVRQVDHALTSGQFAHAFGNADFAPINPKDAMLYVIAHHDEGWQAIDNNPEIDPNTGLPYHLTKTPILKLIASGNGSPDFNEKYNPYSGLISSMHTWGLYHGRYGLSDKIFIDSFPAQYRHEVDTMLNAELDRQERIKSQLYTDPAIQFEALFCNYKLLQFFDTLALYFQTTHESERIPTIFNHVPQSISQDTEIHLQPLSDGSCRLSPYPFAEDSVTVTTEGRYVMPNGDWASAPVETQSYTVVR